MTSQPVTEALIQKKTALATKLLGHVDLYQSRTTAADSAAASSSSTPDQAAQRKVISNLQKVRRVILEEIEEIEEFLHTYDGASAPTTEEDSRHHLQNSSMFLALVPIRRDLQTAKDIFDETDTAACKKIPAIRVKHTAIGMTQTSTSETIETSAELRSEAPPLTASPPTTNVGAGCASTITTGCTTEVIERILATQSLSDPASVDLAGALLATESSSKTCLAALEEFWWHWARKFQSAGALSVLALSLPTVNFRSLNESNGASQLSSEDEADDLLIVQDLRLYELIFADLLLSKPHYVGPFLDRYRPVVNVDKVAIPLLRKHINGRSEPAVNSSLDAKGDLSAERVKTLLLKNVLQQLLAEVHSACESGSSESNLTGVENGGLLSAHHLRAKSSSFVFLDEDTSSGGGTVLDHCTPQCPRCQTIFEDSVPPGWNCPLCPGEIKCWQPESGASYCHQCNKRLGLFPTLNAKHHCRSCGRVVCGKCSKTNDVISHISGFDSNAPERTCVICHATLLSLKQ